MHYLLLGRFVYYINLDYYIRLRGNAYQPNNVKDDLSHLYKLEKNYVNIRKVLLMRELY